jgi:hypothetical protein
MSNLWNLILALQAMIPPPGVQYFARTDYKGPGLICGAAFSFRLKETETARLTKSSAISGVLTFYSSDGEFSVDESQIVTEDGEIVAKTSEGVVRRKHEDGHYVWIYRDNAPGSTVIYGPAVDAATETPAFKRIRFGAPRYEKVDGEPCLTGTDFDRRVT